MRPGGHHGGGLSHPPGITNGHHPQGELRKSIEIQDAREIIGI
jgi:hypothetical protein